MYDSILQTIKKLIGVDETYNVFDMDLIVAINSSFMILNQLGVGPDKPFSIKGFSETWKDFFGDEEIFELAKSYIYLRAKLLFDPPTSGVLHEAIEREISEFEWRMHVQADYNDFKKDSEEDEGSSNNGSQLPETSDHRDLTNRDAPDQHPIGAISGLDQQVNRITDLEKETKRLPDIEKEVERIPGIEKQVDQIPEIMSAEELRKILTN